MADGDISPNPETNLDINNGENTGVNGGENNVGNSGEVAAASSSSAEPIASSTTPIRVAAPGDVTVPVAPAQTINQTADVMPMSSESKSKPEVQPGLIVQDEAVQNDASASAKKTTKAQKLPGSSKALARTVVEIVLFASLLGMGYWAWILSADNKNLKQQVASLQSNPQLQLQRQASALITQVGKLINLPASETPTIANVTDANAAKQQSNFFADAQNGDKVLMYVKAGEAILYRPSTNKVILVAPLTFNNSGSSTTSTTGTSSTSTTK